MAESYGQIKNNFLTALKSAATNQKSSLSFIKNDLSRKPLVSKGIVQTIVIGGTNYVSSLSEVTGPGKYKILKIKKGKQPVFKNSTTFSTFINEHIEKNVVAVGLNFAFPLNPIRGKSGTLDGILLHGTKEHVFEGLIGKRIGELVGKIYFTKYKKTVPVAVANDTICLTLAGEGNEDGSIVLGTGFNMSLKTTGKGINSVVNLEAGNFDGFKLSEVVTIIDSQSVDRGKMLFEKAVAGRYLVTYFDEKAKLLNLKIPPLKTSEELSNLGQSKSEKGAELARSILRESASLVACAIAGIYEFKESPKKLKLIAEGSLFWKGYMYQKNVKKQLLSLGVPKDAVEFINVKDSSQKGAVGLLAG